MLFARELLDPAARRPRYGPDWRTWDEEETADVGVVFREFLAMSGMPVDLEITHRGMLKRQLQFRGEVRFVDASIDNQTMSDRGIRIVVGGMDLALLSEEAFLAARVTPGSVDAVFRTLRVCVGRVNLATWEAYPWF